MWPVYFTAESTMYVDTVFGDYPTMMLSGSRDLEKKGVGQRWSGWNLLSLNKSVSASSCATATPDPETGRTPNYDASMAVDEDVRTWWSAASGAAGEWLQVDLGDDCRVSAIQINFADEGSDALGRLAAGSVYQYYAEVASGDDTAQLAWMKLAELDRTNNSLDMPHDYAQLSGSVIFRHLRLTCVCSGAGSKFSVSGLRVFGSCPREAPAKVPPGSLKLARDSVDPRWGIMTWAAAANAEFYVVRYRIAGDTSTPSYHSFQVYDGATSLQINALAAGEEYEFTVDAVNENGVASGGAWPTAAAAVAAPPMCDMIPKTDFWCYWPKDNDNHTGTWCNEIAQPPSTSAEDCCQLCIKNSSASASAHAGTINCTAFAFNGKQCYLKATATMNVTGHPVTSTDTSGRLVFKTDDLLATTGSAAGTTTTIDNTKPRTGE